MRLYYRHWKFTTSPVLTKHVHYKSTHLFSDFVFTSFKNDFVSDYVYTVPQSFILFCS